MAPDPDSRWDLLAADWYGSLAESGQSRFYQPSDWQLARWCAELMTRAAGADKPAPLVAQIRGLMTDLLVSEGSRRRALIELARAKAQPEGADGVVTELDEYRRRLQSG